MLTCEFLSTCVPAAGEVATTLPFRLVSVVATSVQLPTRSFCCICALASSQLLPLTSGTVDFAWALATVRVMVVPFWTSAPSAGSCSSTVPGSSPDTFSFFSTLNWYLSPVSVEEASSKLWPTTLGTTTFGAPVETTRLTVESFLTEVVEAGSWEQILPLGWFSQVFGVNASFRPMLSAMVLAAVCVWPMKFGVLTLSFDVSFPLNAHFPIRIAPTSTRTAATTSRIVEVFDFFFCWRRRSGRSS